MIGKVIILQFRESLVRSLLLGKAFEKLKSGPTQKSIGQTKRKLADHKLEEKEDSTCDVRIRCAGCYEKIRQQQSRDVAHATAKKIKTFVLIVLIKSIAFFNKRINSI